MNNTILKINALVNPKDYIIERFVILGVCLLAVLIGTYMYFVGRIVFDVVARKQDESQIRLAQSVVGGLQVTYLSELNNIDISNVKTSGLSESVDTEYAVRDTSPTVGMLQ